MKEQLRIGVFICHCGDEIARYINLRALEKEVSNMTGVVYVRRHLYPCSQVGLEEIEDSIRREKLERLVVAGCSPRLLEGIFRRTCRKAGLNPYLMEMANIREGCVWVHLEREEVFEKARELIRMAVAKVALNSPLEPIEVSLKPKALVIGGGIAGMTAAISIANKGSPVILLEKEKELGGMLRRLFLIYPSLREAPEIVREKVAGLTNKNNIEVVLNASIEAMDGQVGDYHVKIASPEGKRDFSVGAIVVATGAQNLKPPGLFGYGRRGVITQMQFEDLMKAGELNFNNIIMIMCAGSRNETRPYCSRVCCMVTLKNAILIKRRHPELGVYILFRDIQAKYEGDFKEARRLGVEFLRYSLDNPPEVGDGVVTLHDELQGEDRSINYNLVVLSTPLIPPSENRELAHLLRIPVDRNGFFVETDVKLRPVDYAIDGIFLAGSAHWPASTKECVYQGFSAASRVISFLETEKVSSEPIIVRINPEICRGCGRCVEVCEFNALEMKKDEKGNLKSYLTEILCKGCGLCASVCESGAIDAVNYTNEQIYSMIDAVLERDFEESLRKTATP